MKFAEMPYSQPDVDEVEQQFTEQLKAFTDAETADQQVAAFETIYSSRREFETMQQLAAVRHSIDTRDEQYETANAFFDEHGPRYQGIVTQFYDALINAKFRPALEEKFGTLLFEVAENGKKVFDPKIQEDLQRENQLVTEYNKLVASAEIEFEGEKRNLSALYPFESGPDREMRKKASEAKWGFFAEHEEEFDRIYDDLVKVRHTIAQKMGHENYVPFGYLRMMRHDYNAEMVRNYREAIKKHIVPIATKLRERQRERLGLDSLKYYDEACRFVSGNATPKGDPEWIIENGKKMYKELSPETDEFFTYMTKNGLLDLVNKPGKQAGGYCTMFTQYGAPFIFSNFNGTSADIDVLTHEAGHAFQVYSSRTQPVDEYFWPTYEACEIHSMSMEFITWPWMELFFKEDTDKYKFAHLSDSLLFLPYGVSVDEFQHWVYEHPEATPKERKDAWRAIEKKYLPYRDYDGNDYLERGGFWQRQGHIFGMPFYYIDYTLAQICAFQFWVRSREESEKAWQDYLNLCKAGGSQTFLQLVELAGLESPFKEGTVEEVAGKVTAWLDAINDKEL